MAYTYPLPSTFAPMMERAVSTLSTEQLYRKRAFDRENQRASRARKRGRVQELEEEVAELRKRLKESEGRIQHLEHNEATLRGIINTAHASLEHVLPYVSDSRPTPEPFSQVPPASNPEASELLSRSVTLRDFSTGLTLELPFDDDPLANLWSDPLWSNGTMSGEAEGPDLFNLAFLGSEPSQLGKDANRAWGWTTEASITEGRPRPPWEECPLHLEPTCELDKVLLGIIKSSREEKETSGQLPEVASTSFPSLASLLHPVDSDCQHPISNAMGRHGKLTMAVSGTPEKLASLYYICLLLRWLIAPTKHNYETMPEYLRPVKAQLTTPHPIWIDTIVWPQARERILTSMDWSEFDVLRRLTGETLLINWPYDVGGILTIVAEGEVRFSTVFETHIRHLDNWTIGRKVIDRFEFLRDVVSIS